FYLSSFNAPPPQNPRLQQCVEDYLAEALTQNQQSIADSIAMLGTVNLDILPKKVAGKISDAQKNAGAVIGHLEDVQGAEAVLAEATITYASFHSDVRAIERDIRKLETQIKRKKREALAARTEEDKQHITEEIEEAMARQQALEESIPAEWEGAAKDYQAKQKVLNTANRKYRRAMDDSFANVDEVIGLINASDALKAYQPRLDEHIAALATMSNEDRQLALKEAEKEVGAITGGSGIKSLLSKARRAYKKDDNAKAEGFLADAKSQMTNELAWRADAVTSVLPLLESYQAQTADTIGLRGQDRLPSFLVPRISTCRSQHRDISLQF
ncbi:MAG: C4-dicarboxylate ABC transporter permease, partial [Candidatus Puniceispirillaceae bacterium]